MNERFLLLDQSFLLGLFELLLLVLVAFLVLFLLACLLLALHFNIIKMADSLTN